MLALIALLPRERADAALWWITGLSGLSILDYVRPAKPWRQGGGQAAELSERHASKADACPQR